jgi:hypothetical protein
VVSVTPRPLFTQGNTRFSLYGRLGGSQGRSEQLQNNLAAIGIRSPDRPARSQSLYRLRYPAHNKIPVHLYFINTYFEDAELWAMTPCNLVRIQNFGRRAFILYLEYRSSKFPLNLCSLLPDYTASRPIINYSS